MHATAELDLTDFGDADTFRRLLNKHELRYDGIRSNDHHACHSWVSIHGDEIGLRTQCNPIDGDHVKRAAGDRDPGYASYITITGNVHRVRSVMQDVLRDAETVKGVSKPLTTEDGVVLSVSGD